MWRVSRRKRPLRIPVTTPGTTIETAREQEFWGPTCRRALIVRGGVREATGRSADWSGHKTTWVRDPVWVLTVDLYPRSLRGQSPPLWGGRGAVYPAWAGTGDGIISLLGRPLGRISCSSYRGAVCPLG